MGRRPINSVLLRARVPTEIMQRVELDLFPDGERKYGAMSDLITSLLQRWLAERQPND